MAAATTTLIREALPDMSRATTATAVYQRIKDDILDGKLAPGLKLRIEFVSERYGAGSSPIREALSRLSSEGIVIRHEQRGFCVAPISLDELREVTTIGAGWRRLRCVRRSLIPRRNGKMRSFSPTTGCPAPNAF